MYMYVSYKVIGESILTYSRAVVQPSDAISVLSSAYDTPCLCTYGVPRVCSTLGMVEMPFAVFIKKGTHVK